MHRKLLCNGLWAIWNIVYGFKEDSIFEYFRRDGLVCGRWRVSQCLCRLHIVKEVNKNLLKISMHTPSF